MTFFGNNKSFAKSVFLNDFQLVDLSIIPDEEIQRHGLLAPMEFIMKHIFIRDLLVRIQDIVILLKLIEENGNLEYIN